ncbi:hypothetical protein MMC07_007759 [Pseudocyphellaria aurata]|nr:hypothetical protein [Pseudocyphellaria aurata]
MVRSIAVPLSSSRSRSAAFLPKPGQRRDSMLIEQAHLSLNQPEDVFDVGIACAAGVDLRKRFQLAADFEVGVIGSSKTQGREDELLAARDEVAVGVGLMSKFHERSPAFLRSCC